MRRFGLFAFLIAIATGCTVGPYVPPPHQEQLKPPQEQLDGVYTIQQKSNRRYVDAYPNESSDYNMVTRDWQGDDTKPDLKELSQLGRTGHLDDTQVWIIKPY